eukprot:9793434-Alexandrium_andersonii.AAC.1
MSGVQGCLAGGRQAEGAQQVKPHSWRVGNNYCGEDKDHDEALAEVRSPRHSQEASSEGLGPRGAGTAMGA